MPTAPVPASRAPPALAGAVQWHAFCAGSFSACMSRRAQAAADTLCGPYAAAPRYASNIGVILSNKVLLSEFDFRWVCSKRSAHGMPQRSAGQPTQRLLNYMLLRCPARPPSLQGTYLPDAVPHAVLLRAQLLRGSCTSRGAAEAVVQASAGQDSAAGGHIPAHE